MVYTNPKQGAVLYIQGLLETEWCILTLNKAQCYLRLKYGRKAENMCNKVIGKFQWFLMNYIQSENA